MPYLQNMVLALPQPVMYQDIAVGKLLAGVHSGKGISAWVSKAVEAAERTVACVVRTMDHPVLQMHPAV